MGRPLLFAALFMAVAVDWIAPAIFRLYCGGWISPRQAQRLLAAAASLRYVVLRLLIKVRAGLRL